jgi:hypothetical protein
MTHEERIEAMARAINEKFYGWRWEGTSDFRKDICTELAITALAAAGVEEMVREAAIMGADFGFDVDAIVARVLGK